MLLWIPIAASLVACVSDLQRREIPDGLSLLLLIGGLLATFLPGTSLSWMTALLGGITMFVVVLPFTLAGGIGAGDLKLLAAIGTWLGPLASLQVLFWVALCGAAAAIVAQIRRQSTYPYAPAIAAGLIIHANWPRLLPSLAGWTPV